MDYKVFLMSGALRDLEEITARIATDDPRLAIRFGDKLLDQAFSLGQFPDMGRIVPEFRDATIREIVHGKYRIVYRIRKPLKKISILRFWHAARGNLEL